MVSLLASSMSKDNWDVTIAMLYKDQDEYPTDESVKKVYLGIQDENAGRIKVLQSRIKDLRKTVKTEDAKHFLVRSYKENRVSFLIPSQGNISVWSRVLRSVKLLPL